MRRLFCILCCIALWSFQYGTGNLIISLPFSTAKYITTDPIGNIYVIADNQLLKFSPSGKPLQNFSDSRNGELRSADASNPMKVLLFYPDMARIITLGTQFAPQSTIELRNLGILQPSLACNSINEGFWIYDQQDFQLKKLSLDLQVTFQSGNLLQVTGKRIAPKMLAEYNQQVFLNDPENGIMIFDQFGGYIKTLPLKGVKSFQVIRNEMICLTDSSIKAFDLKRLTEREIQMPIQPSKTRSFRLSDTQIYLLTNDTLNIYSF